jgi:transposase
MSRRAAGASLRGPPIRGYRNGLGGLNGWLARACPTRRSSVSTLAPHRDFVEAARAEKPDITLQALCDRLSAERGVKADTSMMSRFFRKIGVTLKKTLVEREQDRRNISFASDLRLA